MVKTMYDICIRTLIITYATLFKCLIVALDTFWGELPMNVTGATTKVLTKYEEGHQWEYSSRSFHFRCRSLQFTII